MDKGCKSRLCPNINDAVFHLTENTVFMAVFGLSPES